MRIMKWSLACLFFIGCASARKQGVIIEMLQVRHSPNPCDVNSVPQQSSKAWPYMWYYQTEILNQHHKPLQITEFGFYVLEGKTWKLRTHIKRHMEHEDYFNPNLDPFESMPQLYTTKNFIEFYDDGDDVEDGWIQPGHVAARKINSHGSAFKSVPRAKWSYWAKDHEGNKFYGEAEIISVPITR